MDDHLLECFVQNLVMHSDSTTEPCISLTFLTENAQYPGCAKKTSIEALLATSWKHCVSDWKPQMRRSIGGHESFRVPLSFVGNFGVGHVQARCPTLALLVHGPEAWALPMESWRATLFLPPGCVFAPTELSRIAVGVSWVQLPQLNRRMRREVQTWIRDVQYCSVYVQGVRGSLIWGSLWGNLIIRHSSSSSCYAHHRRCCARHIFTESIRVYVSIVMRMSM